MRFPLLCGWLMSLALIAAGTKLIWGPISERKAFYSAMEEFFRTARTTKMPPK